MSSQNPSEKDTKTTKRELTDDEIAAVAGGAGVSSGQTTPPGGIPGGSGGTHSSGQTTPPGGIPGGTGGTHSVG